MKGEVRLEICSHKFDACLEMNLLIAFLFADGPRARIWAVNSNKGKKQEVM